MNRKKLLLYPKEILEKPWQTPATMTHSWGWHAQDHNWKPSAQMIEYLINNTSKGGNYLLNIGPKPDGTFPAPAIRRLREIGAWLYSNQKAVYGALPVNIKSPEGIYLTQKIENDKQLVFITATKRTDTVSLPFDFTRIEYARILDTGLNIDFIESEDGVTLDIPEQIFNGCDIPVIELELRIPIN